MHAALTACLRAHTSLPLPTLNRTLNHPAQPFADEDLGLQDYFPPAYFGIAVPTALGITAWTAVLIFIGGVLICSE